MGTFLLVVFLIQAVVITVILYVQKKILDNILIDLAIKQLELWQGESRPVKEIRAISHKKLSQRDRDRVAKAASRHFGESLKPVFVVDRSLWGGLMIQVGTRIFDHSLRDRLKRAFA